ncbi:MAG: hypothetical protein M1812_006979 [Candelaria pacifica]|nr:MAG: hypothetical protein M1812_006979 [Candelaria pacifica]
MTKRARSTLEDGNFHKLADDRSPSPPSSLAAPISPPRSRRSRLTSKQENRLNDSAEGAKDYSDQDGTLAAIEAGQAQVPADHLEYFSRHLYKFVRTNLGSHPMLSNAQFVRLYRKNERVHGHHFVVHQHDHPVAGVHYDLRLQFSASSSISFAIMYGLPGNPNSQRLNRNATETRVHNLWTPTLIRSVFHQNHLVETASPQTGSLLIWDTGEYEVIPFHREEPETEDEDSSGSIYETPQREAPSMKTQSENEKLIDAFKKHRIRLRLHGSRLHSYVLSLRLHSSNDRFTQPSRPIRKRRRKAPKAFTSQPETPSPPSSPTSSSPAPPTNTNNENSMTRCINSIEVDVSKIKELEEQEDEQVRLANAYPGASNTIGSIHQRRWFLSLDRVRSGFTKSRDENGRLKWMRKRAGDGLEEGFEPFIVLGREVERSVVTGRTADEVMSDEGVRGYVGRKGWKAVVE